MIDPAAKSPYTPAPETRITHPAWAKTATIYQLNQRQFTPEGTLQAARDHLPRLRALGVDIIWLMPINPIGQERRKGAWAARMPCATTARSTRSSGRCATCARSSVLPTRWG